VDAASCLPSDEDTKLERRLLTDRLGLAPKTCTPAQAHAHAQGKGKGPPRAHSWDAEAGEAFPRGQEQGQGQGRSLKNDKLNVGYDVGPRSWNANAPKPPVDRYAIPQEAVSSHLLEGSSSLGRGGVPWEC
jgi:hypothetical protein